MPKYQQGILVFVLLVVLNNSGGPAALVVILYCKYNYKFYKLRVSHLWFRWSGWSHSGVTQALLRQMCVCDASPALKMAVCTRVSGPSVRKEGLVLVPDAAAKCSHSGIRRLWMVSVAWGWHGNANWVPWALSIRKTKHGGLIWLCACQCVLVRGSWLQRWTQLAVKPCRLETDEVLQGRHTAGVLSGWEDEVF